MGGRSHTIGQSLENALIRDALTEGVIHHQTGSSTISWLPDRRLLEIAHQKRVSVEAKMVDADIVITLEDGARIWIEAKANAKVNAAGVREDVEKMWRQFTGADDSERFAAYVLATNEDSRWLQSWRNLRDALNAHRGEHKGSVDIASRLGIKPAGKDSALLDRFLHRFHTTSCDVEEGSVAQRLTSRLGLLLKEADAIVSALGSVIVAQGTKFRPIRFVQVLDLLFERELLPSIEVGARKAIARVKAASEGRVRAASSLHPEHDWRIQRDAMAAKLDDAAAQGDVVLLGSSGAGKSVLLDEWVAQRSGGDTLVLSGERFRATHETWSEPWAGAGPSHLLEALVRDGISVLVLDGVDELGSERQEGLRDVVRAARATRGLKVVLAIQPRSLASFVSPAERSFSQVQMKDLSPDEIRQVDTQFLERRLEFLFRPEATQLLRLAGRPLILSLLIRLRVAQTGIDQLCDFDGIPTEEELVLRVWVDSLARHEEDEETALRLAAMRLEIDVVKKGQISGSLNRLRNLGFVGADDEQVEFTHRGFHEFATALAISRGYGPREFSWLAKIGNPLIRLGILRGIVAYYLHSDTASSFHLPGKLGALLNETVPLNVRVDVSEALARNVTRAKAAAVMETLTTLSPDVQAETLDWFLAERIERAREGSLEVATNTVILEELSKLLEQAPAERWSALARDAVSLAELLVVNVPEERIPKLRPVIRRLEQCLRSSALRLGSRSSGMIREAMIRSMIHALLDVPDGLVSWARQSLDDEAFCQNLLVELAECRPANPRAMLELWEPATATLARKRLDTDASRRMLEHLLEAEPGATTGAVVRILAKTHAGQVSDDDQCAEDWSLATAGPEVRNLDSWNFPATVLAEAWHRWARSDTDVRLERSLPMLEAEATTVFPRALLLEAVSKLTREHLRIPPRLCMAARRILQQPRWVARPSMAQAAGQALCDLLSTDTSVYLEIAASLLASAHESEGVDRGCLLSALAYLVDHPNQVANRIGSQAVAFGGRPIEPTLVRGRTGLPATSEMIRHIDHSFGVNTETAIYGQILPQRTRLFDARGSGDTGHCRDSREALTQTLSSMVNPADRRLKLAVERELAAECEQIANHLDNAADVDRSWLLNQLPRLAESEDPDEPPQPHDNLGTFSPSTRAVCARVISLLALKRPLSEPELGCAERLLSDANAAVRVEAARSLPSYELHHADWMWNVAGRVVSCETSLHSGHILFWLTHAMRYSVIGNPERARAFLGLLMERADSATLETTWANLRREIVQQMAVLAIRSGGGIQDDLREVLHSPFNADLEAVAEVATLWVEAEEAEEAQRNRARELLRSSLLRSAPGTRSAIHAVALGIARGTKLDRSTWKTLCKVLSAIPSLDRETRRISLVAARHVAEDEPDWSMELLRSLCSKPASDLDFAATWDQKSFVQHVTRVLTRLLRSQPRLRHSAMQCLDGLRPLGTTETGRFLDRLRNLD